MQSLHHTLKLSMSYEKPYKYFGETGVLSALGGGKSETEVNISVKKSLVFLHVKSKKKWLKTSVLWCHKTLILAPLRRQRHLYIYDFKASLLYKSNCRSTRDT